MATKKIDGKERIIYLKNRKIVLNVKEKYLIIYELSELEPKPIINARHFKLIEVD